MFKNLSKQGMLAVVGYILLVLSVFLPYKLSDDPLDNKYYFGERFVYVIVMLLPILISVKTIDCMVSGVSGGNKMCGVLSWLNSVSIFVWALLVLIFSISMFKAEKKNVVTVRSDYVINTQQGYPTKHSELLESFTNIKN